MVYIAAGNLSVKNIVTLLKFISTVKVFKYPPGKNWCQPLPDYVFNLIKESPKHGKDVS